MNFSPNIGVNENSYFIKGIPWENTTGFPTPWAHKSAIIDQVMTLKLQHFTRHFFLNFHYGGASPKLPLGGAPKIVFPPSPLDDYSGGEYPVRCWDTNIAEITSLSQEDHAPQPTPDILPCCRYFFYGYCCTELCCYSCSKCVLSCCIGSYCFVLSQMFPFYVFKSSISNSY